MEYIKEIYTFSMRACYCVYVCVYERQREKHLSTDREEKS